MGSAPRKEREDARVVGGALLMGPSFAAILAQRFHEVYEEAAPLFQWDTQIVSRVAWDELPENQRQLMVYVCGRIAGELEAHTLASVREQMAATRASQTASSSERASEVVLGGGSSGG